MRRAAIYLRSSKDRSDVSIDSQRRQLQELAKAQKLLIVCEYRDVVESAKDENRPDFQRLLSDLKSPSRGWDALLMTDHTRLSRSTYVSAIFKHETQKLGVDVIYAIAPDLDPIAKVMLDAFMEANAQVHSMMSKQKGLAGMAENVHHGYRAGGRAPRGYRLKAVPTGAIREGQAVSKSVLVPSEEASVVKRYLEARIAGTTRTRAAKESGINAPGPSLVDLEWNALTYAGATVWNVRNERLSTGGYKGGKKRRPRKDWVINWDTHEALIDKEGALRLLEALENSTMSKLRSKGSKFVLSGILVSPEGAPWHGETKKGREVYRVKRTDTSPSKQIERAYLEDSILDRILRDLKSKRMAKILLSDAKKAVPSQNDPRLKEFREKSRAIEKEISKYVDLAGEMENPGPILNRIDRLEMDRKFLEREVAIIQAEAAANRSIKKLTVEKMSEFLAVISDEVEGTTRREKLKDLLKVFVTKITLDPASMDCQIGYRFEIQGRDKLASPRGSDLIPVLRWNRPIVLSC